MKVECDFVMDCISGFLPNEKEWDEQIEKHVAICCECQELVELAGELPNLANANPFSAGMKKRIFATVFEEIPGSYAVMFL